MQLQPWQQGLGEKNWGNIPETKAGNGLVSWAIETDKNIEHLVESTVLSLAEWVLKFSTPYFIIYKV